MNRWTGGNAIDRRRAMSQAAGAGIAMNLWGLLRARAAANENAAGVPRTSSIRSCIFIFYYGGPPHLDTWDLKPNAPSTVRGEFRPISTTVPGTQISEHLPRMAGVMHKVALIRSLHHTNRLHDSASTEIFTGRQGPQGDREEFNPIPQFYPAHGAVLRHLRPPSEAPVEHAVLPWLFHNVIDVPCQGGGFLGSRFDPFEISGDGTSLKYRIEVLQQQQHLNAERIHVRQQLLHSLDLSAVARQDQTAKQLKDFSQQACQLLLSEKLNQALDIDQEDLRTRERYGMLAPPIISGDGAAAGAVGRNLRGQNLLIARRLVEAGVPFVNVNDFRQQGQNWDSHTDNFGQLRKYLLPQADQSLSALIEDLDQRGLLDSTLVVALGEFGRTPTINASAGRDHWPDCYSILLAGGGIRGGSVWGSSDAIGAYPETDPVTPADLAATIYWRFGLDPRLEISDPFNRPHRLANGLPLESLFS